jgi:hypothetical protein
VKLNGAQAARLNVNVAVKIDLTGDPAARIMIAVFEVFGAYGPSVSVLSSGLFPSGFFD